MIFFVVLAAAFVAPRTPWFPQVLVNYLLAPIPRTPELVWAPSNIIVVLGGGIEEVAPHHFKGSEFTRSRVLATGAAYRQCKSSGRACIVIASGGDPHKRGMTEAECIKDLLLEAGIPDADIKLERESGNTFENARETGKILQHQFRGDKVFVVTSSLHMRRSLLYFSYFGVVASPVVSEWKAPKLGFQYASYNTIITCQALAEIWGIVRFYIYSLVGWNYLIDPLPLEKYFANVVFAKAFR